MASCGQIQSNGNFIAVYNTHVGSGCPVVEGPAQSDIGHSTGGNGQTTDGTGATGPYVIARQTANSTSAVAEGVLYCVATLGTSTALVVFFMFTNLKLNKLAAELNITGGAVDNFLVGNIFHNIFLNRCACGMTEGSNRCSKHRR